MNINKVFIGGRLTAPPELKTTPGGTEVLRFTVAVNRVKDGADFIDCTAFKQTAENIAKYFTKGSNIFLEGHLHVDAYKDRDSVSRKRVSVIVDRFDFVERKVEKPAINVRVDDGLEEVEEIDLPF